MVPLWVALSLKRDQRCRIITPQWMLVDKLEATLEAERNTAVFSGLPFHYAQVATALLDV